jgi:alkane 1-monooxygenase
MNRSARAKFFGYSLALVLPSFVLLCVSAGAVWLAPFVVFVAFPILSVVIGEDESPPLMALRRSSMAMAYLHALPRLYGFIWIGTLLWVMAHTQTTHFSALAMAGGIVSVGITSAVAICTAHELLHRGARFDVGLARFMTAFCMYGHMRVEHHHHHASVGTPDYGATARRGTSVYRFVVSDFVGALKTAWRIEDTRLARCRLPWWHHKVLQDYALVALFTGFVAAMWGAQALVLFVGQAAFAVFSFEIITYVHHYGLLRDSGQDIGAQHAWAHHCWLTNCLTFNNPFHSDHHLRPRAPYYDLHAMYGAPRLPASYFTMFVVALIPPLWYRLIHPRLDALQEARDGQPPDWLRTQECR